MKEFKLKRSVQTKIHIRVVDLVWTSSESEINLSADESVTDSIWHLIELNLHEKFRKKKK